MIDREIAITGMVAYAHLVEYLNGENAYSKYLSTLDGGIGDFRDWVLETMAPAIESGYASIQAQYHEPFDDEFVPAFIAVGESYVLEGTFEKYADRISREVLAMEAERQMAASILQGGH